MFTFPFQLLSSSPNRVPSSRLHQIKRVNSTSELSCSCLNLPFGFYFHSEDVDIKNESTLGGHRQMQILLSVRAGETQMWPG